jgi:hypothetical protein
MKDRLFWETYSAKKRRPIDELVLHSPVETAQFVTGSRVLFKMAGGSNPDLVAYPYRGAAPIAWTFDAWADVYHTGRFPSVYLPIGTNTEVVKGGSAGPNPSEKRDIINREIDMLARTGVLSSVRSVLLVDEVHSGGTISQAAIVLESVLAQRTAVRQLDVIAAQDSRPQILNRKKNDRYVEMASNVYKSSIRMSTYLLPLIYVDCVDLLPAILRDEQGGYEHLKILHNPEAEALFRQLVVWAHDPSRMEALMPVIKRNEELSAEQLAVIPGLEADYNYLLDALTYPQDSNKVVKPQAIRDWLGAYYSSVKAKK